MIAFHVVLLYTVFMLTDKVYEDIRKKILNLTLKPGSKINFSNLRTSYGVSNSPVRDALKRLEAEGLVCIKPQSGTTVAKIDLNSVEDERFRRLYLELGAIELIFDKGFTEEFTSKMKRIISKQKEAYDVRDIDLFLSLDDSMHRLFFEECKHEKVFDSITSTGGNYARIRMVSYLFDEVLKYSLEQHIEILNAIENHDRQRALSLIRSHISRIENETFAYRRYYPQYFV